MTQSIPAYANFDLQVTRSEPGYAVRVIASPAGES